MILPILISSYWQEEIQRMFGVFLKRYRWKREAENMLFTIKFRYHNAIVQTQCHLPKNKYPIYLFQFTGKVFFLPRLEMFT